MNVFKLISATLLLIPFLCSATDCIDTLKPSTKIEGIGIYSSQFPKNSGLQVPYKYGVQLWHSDDCYFGYLTVDAGNEGDPPYGILSFRKLPTESNIQFNSKLTLGMKYGGPNKPDIPSKDLLEFTGTIASNQITGTFKHLDKSSNEAPTIQKVRLRFEKNSEKILDLQKKETTYGDWKEFADRMLKMSGPKW